MSDVNSPAADDAADGATGHAAETATDRNADVAQLGYEDARDELTRIVAQLEAGSVPLEESMRLWERGEALAAHCHKWLDDAQDRVEQLTGDKADG
jgi:exodeoxyribonuclease VII small subunit